MNTWNYRVILRSGRYAIHKVDFDEEGEPWTCTEDPAWSEGDTLEALPEEGVFV